MNSEYYDFEIKRKILHILTGTAILILLVYNLINSLVIFILLIIGILLSLLSLKIRIPIISWFLDKFERKKDYEYLPGRALIFAVAGTLLALKLFPKDIALASIAILTFADPVSHLIGKFFGKTKSFLDERKNIEGHIAGALISSIIAMFFVHPILAISGALTAMLFESLIIEIQKIQLDDNLIIPLAAGTIMLLLRAWIF